MIKEEVLSASTKELENVEGIITEIERYAIHDGPGVRSVIFLKGCSLRCAWCCNPETQENYIEMAFFEDKCIGCGRCIKNCPHNAITLSNGEMTVDRTSCRKNCFGKAEKFPCTLQCYTEARKAVGEKMKVSDVYKEIIRDLSFYENSGGGITISGGEPMVQPEFVYSILRYCKENWIDTAIETCGVGHIDDYKQIAPYLNVLFVDLKNLDAGRYKEWTRSDNTKVLSNIEELSSLALQNNIKMYVRVPVIPGFNDSEESITDIGKFVKNNCKGVQGIELLPYHKLGRGKYKSIGMEYPLKDMTPPTKERMDRYNQILLDLELNVYEF